MTLLETLALATLIVTVVYETVDVTLKVLQYIESKQKKDYSRLPRLSWKLTIAGQHLFCFQYNHSGRICQADTFFFMLTPDSPSGS